MVAKNEWAASCTLELFEFGSREVGRKMSMSTLSLLLLLLVQAFPFIVDDAVAVVVEGAAVVPAVAA